MTVAAGCALAAALASGSALAAPLTLDFEEFANGDIVTGSQGVGISGVNGSGGANPVVAFFTDPGLNGEDPDLQAPFDPIPGDVPALGLTQGEQGNGAGGDNPVILIIQEDPNECGATSCPSPDDEARGGAVTFDFTSFGGVTLLTIDLFDIDDSFPSPESVTITSFDDGMTQLGTNTISGLLIGENAAGRLDLSIFLNGGNTDVSFLEVAFASSGATGNVTFQTRIPSPAPLAVLAVGLAGVGIARGRAKRRQR